MGQNYARTLYITSCQIMVQKVMGKTHHELASWSSLFYQGEQGLSPAAVQAVRRLLSWLLKWEISVRNEFPSPRRHSSSFAWLSAGFTPSWVQSVTSITILVLCASISPEQISPPATADLLPGLPSPKVPSFIFASALVTKLHGSRGVCPNSIFPISLIFSMRFCRIRDFSGASPLN